MSNPLPYTDELLCWVELHESDMHAEFLLTVAFHRLRTYATLTRLLRRMERSVVDDSAFHVPETQDECRVL